MNDNNNKTWKNLVRPLFILLIVVIGFAIAARFLSKQETLMDYAANYEMTSEDSTGMKPSEEAGQSVKQDSPGSSAVPDISGNNAVPDISGNNAIPDISGNDTTASAADMINDSPETESLSLSEDTSESLSEAFSIQEIPDSVRRRMYGCSYPDGCPIELDTLRYLTVKYVDFDDNDQMGEIVCNKDIAEDLLDIFRDLYDARYQLESVRLIDDFGGDDDASMLANNTSCFNYRTVEGSSSLSNHAYGLAIDINPFYNPWVHSGKVSPPEAQMYADRSADFPHKIDENDLCCKCFLNHGFFWGGNWNNPDYQHFQKN